MDEFHDSAAHLIDEHPEHVNARTEREDATMHAATNTMQMSITVLQTYSR